MRRPYVGLAIPHFRCLTSSAASEAAVYNGSIHAGNKKARFVPLL
jgi:hypothetical protein